MHIHHALDQLEQIHAHLTRSEVYRGFRVPGVALVGILAFVAAAAAPFFQLAFAGIGFVAYWVIVAGICCLLGMGTSLHLYQTREDDFARRRTRRVLAQFSPCLLVGGVMTAAVSRVPGFEAFLPGLWGMVFGLGMLAAQPYLPRGIGLISLGYIAIGAILLIRTAPNDEPSNLAMGLQFGVGHCLSAFVLWLDEKGSTDDRA